MPDLKTVTFDATLKPCPFCGCENLIQGSTTGYPRAFYVGCQNDACGCGVQGLQTEIDALNAWNTRATTPAAQSAGQEVVVIELKRIAHELRTYNPQADEYGGVHIHKGWAKEIDAVLAAIHAPVGDSVMGAFRMLLAACNRLWAEAEEVDTADGHSQVALQQYWDAFIDARDRAQEAIYAAPVNGGERDKSAPLILTGWQLLEALDLIAPDRATDPDQLDGEIALQMSDETGHSGAGMYAWDAEYPEEGSSFLAGERVAGKPSDCSGEPECCPQNEGYGCHCGTRNSDVQRAADAPQACSPFKCKAAQRDGVLCADDECDRANGVRSTEAQQVDGDTRTRVRDAIAEALGDAYDCTRVWSAWGVGTMSEDDFSPVAEDESRLSELVDAVLAALSSPAKVGGDGLIEQHARDSAELRRLCAARDEARRTAEYWKANHLAGNAEIERLRKLLEVKVGGDEREAFKANHRSLDLTEEPDAWGRPKFKHPLVDALFAGWRARAALSADGGEDKRDAERWRELKLCVQEHEARCGEAVPTLFKHNWTLISRLMDSHLDASIKRRAIRAAIAANQAHKEQK